MFYFKGLESIIGLILKRYHWGVIDFRNLIFCWEKNPLSSYWCFYYSCVPSLIFDRFQLIVPVSSSQEQLTLTKRTRVGEQSYVGQKPQKKGRLKGKLKTLRQWHRADIVGNVLSSSSYPSSTFCHYFLFCFNPSCLATTSSDNHRMSTTRTFSSS